MRNMAFKGFLRITRHETRITAFMLFTNHKTRVTIHGIYRRPDHCPRRQAAFFLFAIVQKKILSCASVLGPAGHCFPARCGAAWGGYGAAWAAATPRTGNTAFKVFTRHES
ncbi:MAG: hypothetical protein OXH92_18645 [Bryobacterales bacterium]|nr:hypothetical protein [Bryobacterales bacterium]